MKVFSPSMHFVYSKFAQKVVFSFHPDLNCAKYFTRSCNEMFWKDLICIEDQWENKTFYQDWNVMSQRPEHAACSETSKSATINDQGENQSISCQAWCGFVTVLLFFTIICRLVDEPDWRDVNSSPSCRRKLQRTLVASPHFGEYCCFEPNQMNRIRSTFFVVADNQMHQGRKGESDMSSTAFRPCFDT